MKKELTQEEILEKAHKGSEVWSTVAIVAGAFMIVSIFIPLFFGGTTVAETVGKVMLIISGAVALFAFAQFKSASHIIYKDFLERIVPRLLEESENESVNN